MFENLKLRHKELKPFYKYPRKAFALRNSPYDIRILFRGSHVAIYPELNICFNRIKKSGNTTVSAFLNDLANGFHTNSMNGFKDELLKPRDMTIEQLSTLSTYYSFVVVRNPYSRILSAFLDKVAGAKSDKYAYCAGFGQSDADGFSAFVRFLSGGGVRRDRHFWPQSDLLFQPVSHFNSIAKLENLVEDMRAVLVSTGHDPAHADKLAQPHSVEAGTAKITGAGSKLAHYFTDRSVELVSQIYAADFRQFGYSVAPDWR